MDGDEEFDSDATGSENTNVDVVGATDKEPRLLDSP